MSVRVERSRDFGSESADVGQASGRHGFEWLARSGFIARGAVYGIIGILALKLAFGAGGKTTDQKGALTLGNFYRLFTEASFYEPFVTTFILATSSAFICCAPST